VTNKAVNIFMVWNLFSEINLSSAKGGEASLGRMGRVVGDTVRAVEGSDVEPHLSPALSPNSIGGEGDRNAWSFELR